jgi:hypothetical protein
LVASSKASGIYISVYLYSNANNPQAQKRIPSNQISRVLNLTDLPIVYIAVVRIILACEALEYQIIEGPTQLFGSGPIPSHENDLGRMKRPTQAAEITTWTRK